MTFSTLLKSNALNKDFGLLLIRIIIGLLMAFYGYAKLSHFNEMAASDFWMKNVSFLGMNGKFPLALTIFAELFCSIFLILGLLTRLSLMVLLFCMGYIFLIIFPFSILDSGDNGMEFNTSFIYFIIYLGLFFTGPGKYSIDEKLFTK